VSNEDSEGSSMSTQSPQRVNQNQDQKSLDQTVAEKTVS